MVVEEAKGDRIDFMFKTLGDSLPAHGVELHPFHLRPFQALLYHLNPPLDPTMSTVSLGWAGMESYSPLPGQEAIPVKEIYLSFRK